MATALQAIQNLPLLSWKGLEAAPYDQAGYQFGNRHGRNTFPYVKGATHNPTGANPNVFPVRMWFVNGISNRIDWFPDVWEKWEPALEDGEVGKLTHPLKGEIDAVIVGGSVQLTARHQAGVIVEVTFEQTLLSAEDQLIYNPLSLNLDALVSLVIEEVERAEITAPSEEPVTTLADAAGIVSGTITSVSNDVAGTINAAKGLANEFIGVIQLQNNPGLQVLEDSLVTLWDQFDRAGQAIAKKARTTSTFAVQGSTSIPALASQLGNTEPELIELNPDLLLAPTVGRGTAVTYYTS